MGSVYLKKKRSFKCDIQVFTSLQAQKNKKVIKYKQNTTKNNLGNILLLKHIIHKF